MQQQSSIVYKTCKDGVINMASINKLGYEEIRFSGWIQDVKDERIFVITTAHCLLMNGRSGPAFPYFGATIENANGKKNIGVSMRLLGMDVSADIAVLYSIKPCEQTKNEPLGFLFNKKQHSLSFNMSRVAQSVTLEPGTPVYSISNIYDNGLIMTTGFLQDDDVIYNSISPTYTNFTDQLISTLSSADGSSGAPVLIYDEKKKKGSVIGMVAFTKNVDNYTGGPNVVTLEKVYAKLIELNTKKFVINKRSPVNYNGKTGKGYVGILSYDVVDEYILFKLIKKFKKFDESKYRNQANGAVILEINKKDITIPNSRVQNATSSQVKGGIQLYDIVLEVNGVKVGIYDADSSLNNAEYFKAGGYVVMKVLRPSTAEIIEFKVLCDEYPAYLEQVSVDPSIRLIGFFSTLGAKAGAFLGEKAGVFIGEKAGVNNLGAVGGTLGGKAGGFLGGLVDNYFGL